MNAQRGSTRPRNDPGSRLASRARRAAMFFAACGLLHTACAVESAPASSEQDVAALRAVRAAGDRPTHDGDRSGHDPDRGGRDAGADAADALKVDVLAQAGSGCAQGVKVVDDGGHPKLTFESFDLAIKPGGGEPVTKECTFRLAVTGAGAYRAVELELTAGGNLALDSGKAELVLESSATWSGRGEPQRAKPRAWPGRQILDWRDHSRWTFEQTDATCGGDEDEIDEVAITTKLRLTSTSTARASGDVTSVIIEARALKSARLPECAAGL